MTPEEIFEEIPAANRKGQETVSVTFRKENACSGVCLRGRGSRRAMKALVDLLDEAIPAYDECEEAKREAGR